MDKGQNKIIKNILIAIAVGVAAYTGYKIYQGIASKQSSSLNPGSPSGNTGKTESDCKANSGEFPLKVGSGYQSSSNAFCEQVYIKKIQAVLNRFLTARNAELLTIDGMFGPKTEAALQLLYNNTRVEKWLYDSMLNYFN